MFPESKFHNAMGLNSQSAANMVGMMGDTTASAMQNVDAAPANPDLNSLLGTFRTIWTQLEGMNGDFGGDAEKFRVMQKSMEDWLASLQLPESASSPQGY